MIEVQQTVQNRPRPGFPGSAPCRRLLMVQSIACITRRRQRTCKQFTPILLMLTLACSNGTAPGKSSIPSFTGVRSTVETHLGAPSSHSTNAIPDVVLVGAGDIADCSSTSAEATARLLDEIPGTVFTLGDNAYPNGSPSDYHNCYDPAWGRHKWRTHPTPGNHDYNTTNAAGYFEYFGSAAGDPTRGYYSYDLGAWHVVVLNSYLPTAAGSAQERWLRADLWHHPAACTLAMWHRPRFSSGTTHGNQAVTNPLFQALYDADADVVLSGHEHNYERFAPQNPGGGADPGRGIRQFVVGTGGAGSYKFGSATANSEVRSRVRGVLKLTLSAMSYRWEFVAIAGSGFTDAGYGTCH